MSLSSLAGCGVATVTPFTDGEVDYHALTAILEYQLSGGIDYLVCLGTTGEAATLDEGEQRDIINHTLDVVANRVPVVVGNFGGNDTRAICNKFSRFNLTRASAILSVSPYYNKPTQEGIYQHYKTIASFSPLPIVMYNVPGRTSSNIEAKTVVRLANDVPNIIGVKDASGDMVQATEIAKQTDEFLLLSGDDPSVLPFISCGGMGVISVIANAFPREFSEMTHLALDGHFDKARRIHQLLIGVHRWLYHEGNPAGIKGCLELAGLCSREVRLPLVALSVDTMESLKKEIKMTSPEKIMLGEKKKDHLFKQS